MKKFMHPALLILACALMLGVPLLTSIVDPRVFDLDVRNELVLLKRVDHGSCSGVRVKYQGQYFTISAGHCYDLNFEGYVLQFDESGDKQVLEILKVDHVKDLMLLTSPVHSGVYLADTIVPHTRVHTITRGAVFPSFRTEGEIFVINRFIPELGGYKCISTAPVVPGSSGGPVLSARNQLIGIVSAEDRYGFSYFTCVNDIEAFLDEYLESK